MSSQYTGDKVKLHGEKIPGAEKSGVHFITTLREQEEENNGNSRATR